jgi:hypothetical protein
MWTAEGERLIRWDASDAPIPRAAKIAAWSSFIFMVWVPGL